MNETEQKAAREEALREWEEACNTMSLVFDNDYPVRKIVLKARGDIRDAIGEART